MNRQFNTDIVGNWIHLDEIWTVFAEPLLGRKASSFYRIALLWTNRVHTPPAENRLCLIGKKQAFLYGRPHHSHERHLLEITRPRLTWAQLCSRTSHSLLQLAFSEDEVTKVSRRAKKKNVGGQGLPAMRHAHPSDGHRHRRSIKSLKGVLIEQRSTPDAVRQSGVAPLVSSLPDSRLAMVGSDGLAGPQNTMFGEVCQCPAG